MVRAGAVVGRVDPGLNAGPTDAGDGPGFPTPRRGRASSAGPGSRRARSRGRRWWADGPGRPATDGSQGNCAQVENPLAATGGRSAAGQKVSG